MNTTEFLETTDSLLHHEGLRLESMVTWDEEGSRRWAGSYRSGNWANRLVVGMDTHEFLGTTQELLDEEGLRLENMVAYRVNGKRRWAGVYRSGDWENRLLVGLDSKTFLKETQRLLDQHHLRLIDTETYIDNGMRLWAGISRSGDWTSRFIMGDGVEAFADDTQALLEKKGLRLINLDVYEV
jgi:hypothetical protein